MNSELNTAYLSSRIKRVQECLIKWGVDGLLIEEPLDLFYLLGKELSTGFLILLRDQATLFVDSRYIESCEKDALCNVKLIQGNFSEVLMTFLKKTPLKNLGFDSQSMTYQKHLDLSTQFKGTINLTPLKQPLREIRQIKDPLEQKLLKSAAQIGSMGFDHIVGLLKEGILEKELACELKQFWLKHGGEKVSFEPIIAFGENSSMPHYRAGSSVLKKNQIVLIDCGVIVNHYNSDMTRTIFYGSPDEEFLKIYSTVLEAQQKAIEALKPGKLTKEIDLIARDVIDEKGYGLRFNHGLGHGVGLEIHELPVLKSQNVDCKTYLEEGMVITIEPGIYIPGWGGVRIEDTVLITKNSYEILTTTPKELMIVK
jgi:Xaa-Pro aminopeptidase